MTVPGHPSKQEQHKTVETRDDAERFILEAGLQPDHRVTWYCDELGYGVVTSIGEGLKVRFSTRRDNWRNDACAGTRTVRPEEVK